MNDLLTRNWLLADLMPAEVEWLSKLALEQKIPPGSAIVKKDKSNDSLWILCQGKVVIQITGPGGVSKNVAELGEGDLFGEMSWLDGHPASASIVAETPVRVLRILFSDFEKFLYAHNEAHIQILRKFAINLSHRLRDR